MKGFGVTVLVGLIIAMTNCGPDKGESAKVTVAMSNATSTALVSGDPDSVMPDYFGLKIISVALRYDADPSTPSDYGLESGIYVAPAGCADGGKGTIEVDDKEYEVYTPPSPLNCDAAQMEFLDLARESDEVNADLNAGQYPVIPGTYNQVYVCFMSQWGFKYEDHFSDVVIIDAQESENFGKAGCETSSLDELTIGEGETVTVALEYDLLDGVVVQVDENVSYASDDNCKPSETDAAQIFCVNGINPVPTATKQ